MRHTLLGPLLLLAAPAGAQRMDPSMHGMAMPGMTMPADRKPAARKPARPAKRAVRDKATRKTPPVSMKATSHAGHAMAANDPPQADTAGDPHAGHDMATMAMSAPDAANDPHAGHDMASMAGMATATEPDRPRSGTDLAPGNAPAPAVRTDHLADAIWGAAAMARSRDRDLRREHGGMTFAQLLFNLAEYQWRDGRDAYRWDAEAWIGGDVDRLTIKSEGEGSFGERVDRAEVQALYSRALDPYWNMQAGVRHDLGRGPARSYATVGVEGFAPYWFDVEGALFLSQKGELLGRASAWYDQRVTQDLVLQPRAEVNLAAQDERSTGVGSGVSMVEAGVRLRYQRLREFAPYVGVSWERQYGDTARFSRARGEDTGGISVVAGVRAWF